MKRTVFYFVCLCWSFTSPAQDSIAPKNENISIGKTYIYKTDSLYFGKPNLLHNISHVPSNLWQIEISIQIAENKLGFN